MIGSFGYDHIHRVSEALDIAEDLVGNYYKFSLGQWKRHRFDVKTLRALHLGEITDHALALLQKGRRTTGQNDTENFRRETYIICLQDHQILQAVNRDKRLNLLPFLVYIFTHELIHIVRFCNFMQRFDVPDKEKEKEERVVHERTYEVLKPLSLSKLDYILDAYKDHRSIDMVVS